MKLIGESEGRRNLVRSGERRTKRYHVMVVHVLEPSDFIITRKHMYHLTNKQDKLSDGISWFEF